MNRRQIDVFSMIREAVVAILELLGFGG